MYYKSLVVFALCTIFVVGFFAAISYDTSGVGEQPQTPITTYIACQAPASACDTLSITSASLRTVNYTDELGIVSYATLTIGVMPSGASPITGVSVFIGNRSAGYVQGPFEPGVGRTLNLTIPSTVSVSPGVTYLVSVEGFYGTGSSAWNSTRVTAA